MSYKLNPMLFKLLVILIYQLFTLTAFAQKSETATVDLIQKNIGKEILKIDKYGDSKSTYLGKIIDENGNTKYYVAKEFYRIKAAIVYHGHSRVVFYNSSKKFIAQYIYNMPNELPFKLKSNKLYYKSKEGKVSTQKIGAILPKMLCSDEAGCIEIKLTI